MLEIAPKPDVPPSIRKVPERRKEKNKETETANELRPDAVSEDRASTAENTPSGHSNPDPPTAPAAQAPEKPAVVEPLAPAR